MAFEKKVPEWKAAGTEPPDSLKTSGFTAGYKPPAAYFNWFMNGIGAAVKELQDEAVPTTRKVNSKALSGDITLTATDVGAVPTSRKVNGKALTGDIALTAADLGVVSLRDGVKMLDVVNDKSGISGQGSCMWRTTTSTWGGILPKEYAFYARFMSWLNGSYDLWLGCADNTGIYFTRTTDGALPTSASEWKKLATTDTAVMRDGSNAMTGTLRTPGIIITDKGPLEIGEFIDFHSGDWTVEDFTYRLGIDTEGLYFLKFGQNMSKILHTGNLANYAVPIDGSEKMTGSLKIKDYGEVDASSTLTYLKSKKDINNFRYLRIINPLLSDYTVEKAIQWGNVVNSSEKTYDLYGSHNKPYGSYTGNGVLTNRTIDVGGIGEVLTITSDTGMALVTNRGAICLDRQTGEVSGLKSWEANYGSGVLTVSGQSGFINEASKSYWYQVL